MEQPINETSPIKHERNLSQILDPRSKLNYENAYFGKSLKAEEGFRAERTNNLEIMPMASKKKFLTKKMEEWPEIKKLAREASIGESKTENIKGIFKLDTGREEA